MDNGRGTSRTSGGSSGKLLVVTQLVGVRQVLRRAHIGGTRGTGHRSPTQGCAMFALEVDRFFTPVMLLKKSHLFFSCLLLRLILIFELLHLFLKLFQKLLNCRLIFSS